MREFSTFRVRSFIVIVAGLCAAGFSFTAPAVVISGSSSSYGESVALTGALIVTSGPLPTAGGTAPLPYTDGPNSLVSASAPPVLSTGVLTVNAASNVDGLPGSRFASADATVNGLAVNLVDPISTLSLLSLGATTVFSNAMVSGEFGGLTGVRNTLLTGATLTVAGVPIVLLAAPLANTVAFNGGGLQILLNEQPTAGGDGLTAESIVVNAIHISFANFAFGLGVLNGDIIVSHSQAALTATATPPAAVPAPGTWMILVAGLAALWVQRRKMLGQRNDFVA
jgi:hypothetical protein